MFYGELMSGGTNVLDSFACPHLQLLGCAQKTKQRWNMSQRCQTRVVFCNLSWFGYLGCKFTIFKPYHHYTKVDCINAKQASESKIIKIVQKCF